MTHQTKNKIIFILTILLIGCFIIVHTVHNRNWNSAIIKAERHHLITGEYYNTYTKVITITKSDTLDSLAIIDITENYIVKEQAPFSETYWEDIIK